MALLSKIATAPWFSFPNPGVGSWSMPMLKADSILVASQVKFSRCVLAAIISVLSVANAKAVPITYTETATISGSLNGVSFNNALFTVTGTGDTAAVTGSCSGVCSNVITAIFSVSGVGSGSLTGPYTAFAANSNGAVGIQDGVDLIDTFNSAFNSYALSTSIGPITGTFGGNFGNSFPTSAGPLIYTNASNSTFTAVVGGASAVPLPATLPLFATGLGALGLLGWRRRRKAFA
jgi:hypothetical protein